MPGHWGGRPSRPSRPSGPPSRGGGGGGPPSQGGGAPNVPSRSTPTPSRPSGPPGGGDPQMTYTAPPVITTGGGWTPGAGGITNIFPRGRRTTTGGITGTRGSRMLKWLQDKAVRTLTGEHFGEEGNREKLINAYQQGLITEDQYKRMSGYDASQEIIGLGGGIGGVGSKVTSVGLTSLLNNIAKVATGGKYEDIGFPGSIYKNIQGGLGLPENELAQYEGIRDLDWRSLRDQWAGPMSTPESRAQIAYDFNRGGIVSLYG